MQLDKPEHKELLLRALSALTVTWSPQQAAEAEKTQEIVKEVFAALNEAEVSDG